jgi:hypothetical protein
MADEAKTTVMCHSAAPTGCVDDSGCVARAHEDYAAAIGGAGVLGMSDAWTTSKRVRAAAWNWYVRIEAEAGPGTNE